MPASKRATPRSSADLPDLTDLARVDAHVVQPHEYDDLPELTDEWFEQADIHAGGLLVRRGPGRPRLEKPKRQVTLRLDQDVVDDLRAGGPGWQTRVNDVLRAWLEGNTDRDLKIGRAAKHGE